MAAIEKILYVSALPQIILNAATRSTISRRSATDSDSFNWLNDFISMQWTILSARGKRACTWRRTRISKKTSACSPKAIYHLTRFQGLYFRLPFGSAIRRNIFRTELRVSRGCSRPALTFEVLLYRGDTRLSRSLRKSLIIHHRSRFGGFKDGIYWRYFRFAARQISRSTTMRVADRWGQTFIS